MGYFLIDKMARVVPNEQSIFRHRFGGPNTLHGATPQKAKAPLHLLYTFDTSDPLFPFQIPGVRYLPLCYGFPYNAGAVGYRVLSDEAIEILYMETNQVERDFPYENYPDQFSEVPVALAPISYEEHKTLAYRVTLGESFREDEMSDEDQIFLKATGYLFTQLGGIQLMWQGIPDVNCPH